MDDWRWKFWRHQLSLWMMLKATGLIESKVKKGQRWCLEHTGTFRSWEKKEELGKETERAAGGVGEEPGSRVCCSQDGRVCWGRTGHMGPPCERRLTCAPRLGNLGACSPASGQSQVGLAEE